MISVIIPVHEYNDAIEKLLNQAVSTVILQIDYKISSLILVFPTKIKGDIEIFSSTIKGVKIVLIENEGNFDFQSQINLAVSKVETEYFSILEFDDIYSQVYFRNVDKYIKAYPDVDLFLPFILQDDNAGGASFMNEHAWSKSHMEENGELGYINVKSLKEFSIVNVTGGVFKTKSFVDVGGLKKRLKLSFWYEMLLRMSNSGLKIFVIPKVGYKHILNRENSLFMIYSNTMNEKEKSFWYDVALKEYYFNEDRVLTIPEFN